MTESLTPDACEAMAVFPLPRLVLFPSTTLSLHIFEPRYRDMMADCLKREDPVMAVAQLRPGWRKDYEGRPPIHEVAGAGRITSHRLNSDGTYDLELDGIARVRLHELEPAGLSYRRARAEILHEIPPGETTATRERPSLWMLALQVAEHVRRVDGDFELFASADDASGVLVDRLADQLVTDPDSRQQVLETVDVDVRIELVRTQLARLHLALLANETNTSTTLH